MDADSAIRQPQDVGPFRWRVRLSVMLTATLILLGAGTALWLLQGRDAGAGTQERLVAQVSLSAGQPTSDDQINNQPGEQGSDGSVSSEAAVQPLIVHVAGAVQRPGIVTVSAGSRVYQALDAAGGVLPGAAPELLNLAAPVQDGEQLLVLTAEEAADQGAQATVSSGSSGAQASGDKGLKTAGDTGKVNVNTATAEQLTALPGIGPALSQRIVDWRERFGRFTSAQQLEAVSGIGPKLLETLTPLVSW